MKQSPNNYVSIVVYIKKMCPHDRIFIGTLVDGIDVIEISYSELRLIDSIFVTLVL